MAPLAPVYTKSFRGECAPKKHDFFGRNFQKVLENAVFDNFSKICLRRRKFRQIRIFIDETLEVWESSENQFGRPKKMSTKIQFFFENPPLEKFLDSRLTIMIYQLIQNDIIETKNEIE